MATTIIGRLSNLHGDSILILGDIRGEHGKTWRLLNYRSLSLGICLSELQGDSHHFATDFSNRLCVITYIDIVGSKCNMFLSIYIWDCHSSLHMTLGRERRHLPNLASSSRPNGLMIGAPLIHTRPPFVNSVVCRSILY